MLFSNVTVSEKAQTTPHSTTQTVTSSPTTMGLTTSDPAPTSAPVKAILDLDVTAVTNQINNPWRVAALPEGHAAVVNAGSQVVKINKTGQTVKALYSCSCDSSNHIWGILSLGYNLYVTHKNGTIVEIKPHTGQLLNVYDISDVNNIIHFGSLWSDPSKIPNTDILLLPDYIKGEVFSYNLTSRHKQVHLTGLSYPSSVSYSFYNNSTHYIVCQQGRHKISIYNSSWHLVSSFGGVGTADGYLYYPLAAIMSYSNTILVSDSNNDRMSVFTIDGVFLYHLLTQSDGIFSPRALSYYKPYLWVVNYTQLHRYMINVPDY